MSNILNLSASCDPAYTLGTGQDLRVMLLTRGGDHLLAELKPTSGHFTRTLDKTSVLEMVGTVGGKQDDPCCADWSQVVPWNTEILVIRDGRDAWAGPVTDVKYDAGSVSVMAEDLTTWYEDRIVPYDMKFKNVSATQIFKALHEAAMSVDPIPNFNLLIQSEGVLSSREYLYAQSSYVQDAIAELARTAVDFTAYGRTIIVGGESLDSEPILLMTDDMWESPPHVRAKGKSQATFVMVNAKENLLGIAQSSKEYIDFYGRLDRIFDDAAIEDQAGAQLAAETRLAMLQDPYYIESPQGAALKPSVPITVAQLIPGMCIRVESRATCKEITADFRLSGIDVNFNGKVQVDMQPYGSGVEGITE